MPRRKSPGHTPVGAALTELVVTIFRTNGRLLRHGDKMLRDLKLTSARWQVLASVNAKPRTVAQIAREYELTRQGVLWVVQSMIADGLVELVHNPDHRRAKLVKLTDLGQTQADIVNDRQRAWANDVGESFNLAELKATIELLQKFGDIALEYIPHE